MAKIDTRRTREHLNAFEFTELFVEELGWGRPASTRYETAEAGGVEYRRRRVAELAGVVVMEVETDDIPDAGARAAIHRQISELHYENLLVFVDRERTRSLWYWVKRENGKRVPREHPYFHGQTGDLFLSRLSGLFMDLGDFDEEGNVREGVVGVANRLRDSLDVERVTRKFYRDFKDQHDFFLGMIEGIGDERDRRWYASVMLNRLMFIYFLQEKFFLDGGATRYLRKKLEQAEGRGGYWYYDVFLQDLFFEGFAKPAAQRSERVRELLGEIPYLSGGLFLRHSLEERYAIRIPDTAFERLLALFESYSWNLNDTPGGKDDEINPDVLGYIFEKYINQKAFGAYYTRTEITGYLCEQTIHRLILQKVNDRGVPGAPAPRRFDSLSEMILRLDAPLCRYLLEKVLPELSILDPACGSGAFLVAAMKTLIDIYGPVIGHIKLLNDRYLSDRLAKIEREHPSLPYYIKKQIISSNLFGVDLMEEATEIARLRLFLALVSSVERADQMEPLPNIDFNILAGNSLIGLLQVDEAAFDQRNAQGNLFFKPYRELVREKNRLVKAYRDAAMTEEPDPAKLHDLRKGIEEHRREANRHLNEMLLDEFSRLGIRFEEATWDAARGEQGRPKRRALTLSDIVELHPFHWAYEFDEVLVGRGGFDVIITNPPWDAFKPQGKEFFAEYSELVTTNKMTIKEFEREQGKLLKNGEVREAWLKYHSRFPHANLWFRTSPQFRANQHTPVVNRKRASIDLNLYKLFTEQSYHLLRPRGECGIVVPSGIYTDLGSMGLREMLFARTRVSGLFGFENRKSIFEGVDSRFKFVVLTFEKGGATERFPAAFMRHDV
ncbi:MAG TPA: DNA methyltransferase, partial [Longimicrobiaceae bacterium]|nr:DNA methyltransferase [Longimicrobiaceae bacterium]